jgi:hypothetical protein
VARDGMSKEMPPEDAPIRLVHDPIGDNCPPFVHVVHQQS